jgi:uncharacterized protein DUF3558
MDEPGKPGQNTTYDASECAWDGTDVGFFAIVLVTNEGIETWRDPSRAAEVDEVDPVDGYPALSVRLPDDDTQCYTVVDVADGQYLLANVGIDNNDLSRVPEPCEYAHQFAESAMSTLVDS